MKTQLNALIQSQDLKDVTIDIVESVLDSSISNEVLQEVPFVKSLIAIKNVYSSISDNIFLKKAMNVLLELKDVGVEERANLVKDLDDKFDNGIDKIMMAIDKIDTSQKCRIFGRLCNLKAYGKLDKSGFLRLTKLIQDAYLEDLSLINDFKKWNGTQIWEGEYYSLITLGLLYQEQSEQKNIEMNPSRHSEADPEIIGGKIEFTYHLTDLGELLLNNYEYLFSDE